MSAINEFLAHYGVKGMKWGVRRDEAVLARITGGKLADETKEEKQAYKAYKKSTSGKERRQDRRGARESLAAHIVETSVANPKNFVKVGTPGYPTLMRGQEFVDYLSRGGAFNPMTTSITNLQERS
jgi:hypothetical protein